VLKEPAALPGWLKTTTQRRCFKMLQESRRDAHEELPSPDQLTADPDADMVDRDILIAERNAALRKALAELPRTCRDLLSMLLSDPPRSYAEISSVLGMPEGSIGPNRGRCLDRLRRSPHIAGIIDTGPDEQRGPTGKGLAQ
jgi:DNA-directed RNA polymerase specialized sigma24 family protein